MAGNWVTKAQILFGTNGRAIFQALAKDVALANGALNKYKGSITAAQEALASMGKYSKVLKDGVFVASDAFTAQAAKVAAAESAMANYERTAARTAATNQKLKWAMGFAFAGAAAGAAITGYGVSKAADLQQAMTNVDIATLNVGPKKATPLTDAQRSALLSMAIDTSGATAQSAVTIAKEMAVASTSGLNDFKQLTHAFPQIAKLADLMWAQKGADPSSTVKYATQFSHYFGAYSGKPLQNMLDDTYRLMQMQPEHMEQLVRQGKYFIPMASRMGMDEHSLMEYMALLGQTGLLSGRGGTGIGQILYHAMNTASLTGSLSKAQASGLSDLGLLNKGGKLDSQFLKKNGGIDIDALVAKLVADRVVMAKKDPQRGPSNFASDLKDAFGVNATQILSIFASELSQDRMRIIRETMSVMPGVEAAFHTVSNNFKFQWNAFTTNIENLFSVTFLPILPTLTGWLVIVNARLREWNRALADHPHLAGAIAVGIIALTAAMIGLGLATGFTMIANTWATAGALKALNASIAQLGGTSATVAVESSVAGKALGAGGLLGALRALAAPAAAVAGPLLAVAAFLAAGYYNVSGKNKDPMAAPRLGGPAGLGGLDFTNPNGYKTTPKAAPKHAAHTVHVHGPVSIHVDGSKDPNAVADAVLRALGTGTGGNIKTNGMATRFGTIPAVA